jgi:5-methylcytosine-specific restriction endonuclease McrA
LPPAEWHIVRTIVLVRDGHKCAYCGSVKKLHVDHKIPVCRGGSNGFENLLTSCPPGNLSEGPKLLEDWKGIVSQ